MGRTRTGLLLAFLSSVTVASAAPPTGFTWLSQLTPLNVGPNPPAPQMQLDHNFLGGPIGVWDHDAGLGLGMQADYSAVYGLGQECTRFQAAVGIDDAAGATGNATFDVFAIYDTNWEPVAGGSGTVTGPGPWARLDLDVRGAKRLRLRTHDGGDGTTGDLVDWADARLLCGPTPEALAIFGPRTGFTNTCVGPYTVVASVAGVPMPQIAPFSVAITTAGNLNGTFYTDASCTAAAGTSVTIPAGASRAQFWVRSPGHPSRGGGTFQASAAGVPSPGSVFVELLAPEAPDRLVILGPDRIPSNACSRFSVVQTVGSWTALRQQDTTVTLTGSSGVTFYATPSCATAASTVVIPTGRREQDVFVKVAADGAKTLGASANAPGAISATPFALTTETRTLGAVETLVARVNLSDASIDAEPGCTAPELASVVFDHPQYSLARFLNTASRGAATIQRRAGAPDIVTVSIAATQAQACDPGLVQSQIDAALGSAGVNIQLYDLLIYKMPASCSFHFGGNGRVWSYQQCQTMNLYSHEAGHALGFGHAPGVWEADPTWDYTRVRGATNGHRAGTSLIDDTWDYSTVMGSTPVSNYLVVNAPIALRAGWVPAGAVQVVTANGQYQIGVFDAAPGALPQILKIKTANHGWYYLSYRQPVTGTASQHGQIPDFYFRGVSVHSDGTGFTGPAGAPEDTDLTTSRQFGVLRDGEDFTDPVNGIVVHQVSHGATSVTVDVTVCANGCCP
ncbi:MAG TPA: NPCBM/NEW2 domain-containing protein [Candidatus Binatia bacterium]|jgi:hypothetical protein|nr:NPCBM/NEW2 domain-containing protein [Candidatus Binatia bacterium]